MPTCSETYGQGWVGEYPNCTYGGFSGTVDSLGYGTVLEGSTLEDDWHKYFDPYDVTKEDLLTATAGIDVGQLKTAWGLKGKQLGEVWGAKTSELEGTADIARKGANVAYSGTIETGLKKGLKAGESVYKQAIETGRLGLEQATTDIYQGLGADIYAERTDWKEDQRDTLNVLLGMDVWDDVESESDSSESFDSNIQFGNIEDAAASYDSGDLSFEGWQTYFTYFGGVGTAPTDVTQWLFGAGSTGGGGGAGQYGGGTSCTPEYNYLGQCVSCC